VLQDGFFFVNRSAYHANMAADVPEHTAWAMAASQKAVTAATAYENVTAPAWRDTRSWYAVSTEDKMIDPAAQRFMAGRAGAETVDIRGSHYTPASRAKEVAALIVKAAKAVVG
jgi:hypothetical protein